MLKFLSELTNLKVISFQEQASLGMSQGYLINPDGGQMIGIFLKNPISKKVELIPANYIKTIGPNFLVIDGLESLTPVEEIIAAKAAITINPRIIGELVYTETGTYLGKVREATINTNYLKLDKLYVNSKLSLKVMLADLIIPAAKIITIEKRKIIVTDESIKILRKVPSARADLSPA